MHITDGKIVEMEYSLKDDEGKVLDVSEPKKPLIYLHGYNNIISGLEAALDGRITGERFEVRIIPKDAYGEFNPSLKQIVSRSRFQGVDSLEVGMHFQVNTEQGPISVRVVGVDQDDITIDGNHPLAGKNLNFNVTIKNVRSATEEEISDGHFSQGSACCGGEKGAKKCCHNKE